MPAQIGAAHRNQAYRFVSQVMDDANGGSAPQEDFNRAISRAWRIPTRSAGADRSLGLPNARPKQVRGRRSPHETLSGGIFPLRWAASCR